MTNNLEFTLQNIWSECLKSKDPVIPNTIEFLNNISLAHKINGEGFDYLSLADIDELLVDKTLSKEEIIEVVLETFDHKEHTDSEEEEPVFNADLIKEGLSRNYIIAWPK